MSSKAFLEKLEVLSRDELLEIIKQQDPSRDGHLNLHAQVRRCEWVFEHKLRHLTWPDGSVIEGRLFTNKELALLIDEPFTPDNELTRMGISIEQQKQLHVASDPVLWAKHFLEVEPRAYQILMLRHHSIRKVLRAGRRLGKTYTMSIMLLHYSYTHKDGKCIVVTPMKSQAEVLFKEIMRLAKNSKVVSESITRNVTSPQYNIELSNGSSILFFTSGMRSGGKADVVRGQEAHVIVLDELDYMHRDDLESLYAMLMKTAEDQEDKILIGASTPTGRHEHFYDWCNSADFQEFWFPSYCNPFFSPKDEKEFRLRYTEMGYRHEIEADWGEDVDGVYPRKYVDIAFNNDGWDYIPDIRSARSFFVMGVDWDKYGAGVNMVVLEVCNPDHEVEEYQGKIRLAYREEFSKGEFTYTESIKRIIELNDIFNPRHIYVDKGSGEVQVELLHKYGIEHPESQIRKRVVGFQFGETIEVRDPHTKQLVKKKLKPFMVDNLCQMLEDQRIIFSSRDDEQYQDNKSLYKQLISYVVVRTTQSGDPIFEASGTAEDHCHDALVLACLAITKNYGDLLRANIARKARVVSSDAFLPVFTIDNAQDEAIAQQVWGTNVNEAPVAKKRKLAGSINNKNPYRPIRRKLF